jgi:hypothetical protein
LLTPREELAEFLSARSLVLIDNGRFVQAIEPAALSRRVDPDNRSHQLHLEITMLAALGLSGTKPAWVDEDPVIRPDGSTLSRYSWPPQVENPELLAAAKLPPHVLDRLIPPGPLGSLGDALFERVNVYADEAKALQHYNAMLAHERGVAEPTRLNELNRARRRGILGQMASRPQPKAAFAAMPPHPGWPAAGQPAAPPRHSANAAAGLPPPQHATSSRPYAPLGRPHSTAFHPPFMGPFPPMAASPPQSQTSGRPALPP